MFARRAGGAPAPAAIAAAVMEGTEGDGGWLSGWKLSRPTIYDRRTMRRRTERRDVPEGRADQEAGLRPSLELVRSVTGEQRGFHRTLATTVRWAPAAELPSTKRRCTLLVLEVLGEGLFVDPYELESLQLWRRRQAEAGADEAWLLFETPELEKPADAALSTQSAVVSWVELALDPSLPERTLEMPVHMRYLPPQRGDPYSVVAIPPPTAAIRCEGSPLWSTVDLLAREDAADAEGAGVGESLAHPLFAMRVVASRSPRALVVWSSRGDPGARQPAVRCATQPSPSRCCCADAALCRGAGGVVRALLPAGRLEHASLVWYGTLLATAGAALLVVAAEPLRA